MKSLILLFCLMFFPLKSSLGITIEEIILQTKGAGQDKLLIGFAKELKMEKKLNTVIIKRGADNINSISLTYNFEPTGNMKGKGGLRLNPGDVVYVSIPPEFSLRPMIFLILHHRVDPSEISTKTFITAKGRIYNQNPGLTSVQIYSGNEKNHWRYWGGMSSGPYGGKLAEPRNIFPEEEGLYEWIENGHISVYNPSEKSNKPLFASGMRIVSTGDIPIYLHKLVLKIAPLPAGSSEEVVFSSNTNLGDSLTAKDRKYGGGWAYKGLYPGALPIFNAFNNKAQAPLSKEEEEVGNKALIGKDPRKTNPFVYQKEIDEGIKKLPSNWRYQAGDLIVEPTPGKNITSLEIMLGDSWPDSKPNQDGGIGTSGSAKLDVILKRKNGEEIYFLKGENVPPQGVLYAGPPGLKFNIKPEDQIIIRSKKDISYIMAIRINY
jgi:hypothetical protein